MMYDYPLLGIQFLEPSERPFKLYIKRAKKKCA